jgi:hypothetical protein
MLVLSTEYWSWLQKVWGEAVVFSCFNMDIGPLEYKVILKEKIIFLNRFLSGWAKVPYNNRYNNPSFFLEHSKVRIQTNIYLYGISEVPLYSSIIVPEFRGPHDRSGLGFTKVKNPGRRKNFFIPRKRLVPKLPLCNSSVQYRTLISRIREGEWSKDLTQDLFWDSSDSGSDSDEGIYSCVEQDCTGYNQFYALA